MEKELKWCPLEIKITKDITDIKDHSIRPIKGKVYKVKDIKPALFNPCKKRAHYKYLSLEKIKERW